jgi:hypothetical protein
MLVCVDWPNDSPAEEQTRMKTKFIPAAALFMMFGLASSPAQIHAQAPAGAGASQGQVPDNPTPNSNSVAPGKTHVKTRFTYERPSEGTKFKNYLFDAYGPYPIVGSVIVAGINQANNTPPEWGGGMQGFGRRVGSNYGINAITTTTRYALSEVLHQDTLYYRCQCTGFFPRFGHALVSTLAARHGDEGHYIFSVPALVAPYVGTMTATHTWFPGRYSAADAFRMGNYNLLALAGGNVAIEFLYHGPHTFLSRIHLNNTHAAPEPDR